MHIDARFHPGQRWVSVTEPELGLGEVRAVGPRTVTVYFPATGDTRQYVATGDAPVRRAAFRPGDRIATVAGREAVVHAVTERGGLLYYDCGDRELCETELSHALGFSGPAERLFAGQFDTSQEFELRAAAIGHQFRRRRSDVRGFTGGRIELLPHQLGIAAEVTGRLIPRVLLADEVGLGKTIEACLIVHRLLLTGRAGRVLVIVPETLVHQWFLELLRRFNLWFHIFTEARCVAIEEARPDANPFLDDQLLLCDLRLFTENAARVEQAIGAGWDMVVIDEAHHLRWTPDAASPEYLAVERLGQASPGLLLLTATPEQLGVEGHFARLRLLDPDRFHDLGTFVTETAAYTRVAHLVRLLKDGIEPGPGERAEFAAILDDPDAAIDTALSGDPAVVSGWIERLLDQHGTGRVMFRNTRATIAGCPVRVAHLHPLAVTGAARHAALAREWAADTSGDGAPSATVSLAHDPRVGWLVTLLQSLAPRKVLLLCRTGHKAVAIERALRHRTTIPMASFHEGMTLVQRDRAAAAFADPDGVRLLIGSEIGSEGRNFQFAHHLVLFDLPLDPALLEQRIGRLDRIGQREVIQVHVPFIRGSHLEVLTRWYHEGLNAFEAHVPGAGELSVRFQPDLLDLIERIQTDGAAAMAALDRFIPIVQEARRQVAARLDAGRDRLLEWNSFRPALAARIAEAIRQQDEDRALDAFMLEAFDLFAIQVEEIAPRTWRLGSAGVLVDDFPGLKAEGLTCTRDRARALLREDLQFLTWDHPLATGALDMLLGSERGNCAFARWPDPDASALYLDAVYVLECLAPAAIHVDRFLPPTPVRVIVDHRGVDVTGNGMPEALARDRRPAGGRALVARADVRDTLLPRLLDRTRTLAGQRVPVITAGARDDMHARLRHEVSRLRALQKVNRLVRDEEIARLIDEEEALDRAIGGARLRLDAVRLVYRGP